MRSIHVRPMHNMPNTPPTIPSEHHSSALSPASSRPSTSSPPSDHSIVKITSINGQSSEESEDEHIDVVKSAFVPITRHDLENTNNNNNNKNNNNNNSQHQTPPKIEIPDSTVHDNSIELPITIRNEFKAVSAMKEILHEKPLKPPSSPSDIKVKVPPANPQKTVWRPY